MRPVTSSLRRRAPLAAALVAGAVVTAACGGGGKPGVAVKGLDADIAFGIDKKGDDKPTVQDVAPTPPSPKVGATTKVALESASNHRLYPALRAADECPVARGNSFPARPATQEVVGLARSGYYQWKRGGYFQIKSLGDQKIPLVGFEDRIITNVAKESETINPVNGKPDVTFTYDWVVPAGGGTETRSFRVRTNAATQQEINVQTGQRARPGTADRGLVQTATTIRKPNGQLDTTITYSPGILLLPLPVSPGEEWTSSSVSQSKSGEGTIRVDAQVVGKARIDACGQLMEGWEVKGTLTDQDNGKSTLHYFVAPQYGATVIYESYEYASSDGHVLLEYGQGQVDPTAGPKVDQ